MVAQTRHGSGNGSAKKRLAFHEKLSGKTITTDALLKKLKTLHHQLAAFEQEHVDVNSLGTVRTELIHTSLLLHKDRGVKAYTACCLADILRLYAPEAPYTQHELRDIFQFFFRQLSAGFKGQDEPYYTEYFHLIESLSTVKSVVLVCDLPSADELLTEIFRDFFTIVKRDFTRKVELYMADILVALIEETASLPNDILDLIMSQFIDKSLRNDQPGYRLAVQVCNGAADKLQRHVCQHFGDLLTSKPSDDDEEETDQESIRTSHDLIKRLFRACPGVLHSVIPILETELRSEGVESRLLATQTLGEMYADKGGVDLVKKYPTTWMTWINRKADIAVSVRLKCVEATPGLITNLPECRETLAELLNGKIFDPDERVRAAVCKVYSHLDYEAALHHVSEEQLRAVVGRGLDKKHAVRVQALNSIGKLYSLAYPEIENNDAAAIQRFAWIPDEIILTTSANSEIRSLVEQVLAEYIIPLSVATSSATKEKGVDEVAWTDRLLVVMRYLSEKAAQLLIGLSGLKSIRPNVYDIYLESCVKNNGGTIDGDEEAVVNRLMLSIRHLSTTFVDPLKASDDLNSFAKLNEGRLYKLLKTCMDPQTDLKTLIKSRNEFTKRVEQVSSSILPTMSTFLHRATYWIVNQSAIPTLLLRVQKVNGPRPSETKPGPHTKSHLAGSNALTILTAVAKHSPPLFRCHLAELSKVIANRFEEIESVSGILSVEIALMALANVVRWDSELAANLEKKTNERIVKIALGSDWRQAKFAARYLAFAKNSAELCTEVVESIADRVRDRSKLPAAQIAVLSQLARFCPDVFEQKSEVLVNHLVKKILMVPSTTSDMEHPNEEWFENNEVPEELRAKILALKVLRNRCLAHQSNNKALEIATPVMKLLATLLEFDGSMDDQVEENPKFKSRMRLQAAISFLHLSTNANFANAISPKFIRIACVIQDPCFHVRLAFLTKVILFLQPRKLPARFNVIPFMTVLDPEPETKQMAASYVENAKRRLSPAQRLEILELLFIRLLHILAHHPDFATTQDELMEMATYLQFYFDLLATPDNVSLFYHLASRGKTVRDAESHGYSVNFYMMCELAQALIKLRAQAQSWTLPSYPGKVKLPSDILRPLPNAEATNQILKTIYLPQEVDTWIIEKFKANSVKEKKERVPAKRKAQLSKSNGHAKRPRKRGGTDVSEHESPVDDSDVEMEYGQSNPVRPGRQRASDASEEGVGKLHKLSRAERLSARTLAKEKRQKDTRQESSEMEDEADKV